jgi:psp operon transcriptional activator
MTANLVSIEQVRALGESEAFLALQERISLAAKTNRPVILIGERGTGKELAAARLHLLSKRWGQPYVTLNCASLSESLIESELFGHEVGACSGDVRLR